MPPQLTLARCCICRNIQLSRKGWVSHNKPKSIAFANNAQSWLQAWTFYQPGISRSWNCYCFIRNALQHLGEQETWIRCKRWSFTRWSIKIGTSSSKLSLHNLRYGIWVSLILWIEIKLLKNVLHLIFFCSGSSQHPTSTFICQPTTFSWHGSKLTTKVQWMDNFQAILVQKWNLSIRVDIDFSSLSYQSMVITTLLRLDLRQNIHWWDVLIASSSYWSKKCKLCKRVWSSGSIQASRVTGLGQLPWLDQQVSAVTILLTQPFTAYSVLWYTPPKMAWFTKIRKDSGIESRSVLQVSGTAWNQSARLILEEDWCLEKNMDQWHGSISMQWPNSTASQCILPEIMQKSWSAKQRSYRCPTAHRCSWWWERCWFGLIASIKTMHLSLI